MDNDAALWPAQAPLESSRRQHLRFSPPPGLTCSVAGSSAKFIIRDISVGGLALWSDRPLGRDAIHKLTLKLGSLVVVTGARAAHCKRHDDGRWIIGMAFATASATEPTIEQLIDLIAASTLRFS